MERFNYMGETAPVRRGVDLVQQPSENSSTGPQSDVEEQRQGEERRSSQTGNRSTITEMFELLMQQNQRREELLLATITSQRVMASPSQSYQVMPDLTKSIPVFDGEGSGTAATEWLRTVESVANLHQWPDNFKLESARMHLVGAARYWFSSRNFDCWEQFRDAFKRTFGGRLSIPELWKRMQARVQIRGESTMMYFHEKVHYCQALKFNFDDTKRQLLIGLWSRQMCSVLMAKRHVDLDELLTDIREFEEIETERVDYHMGLRRESTRSEVKKSNVEQKRDNRLQGPSTKGHSQTVLNSDVGISANSIARNNTSQPLQTEKGLGSHVRRQFNTPKYNEAGEPRCFNCNDFGHVARDCPKPQKVRQCKTCGQDGHSGRNCPNSKQITQIMSVKQDGKRNLNKYLKWVKLGDRDDSFQGLIDSGSSCCTVRASAATRLGTVLNPVMEHLAGFGEESSATVVPLGQIMTDMTIDGVCGKNTSLYVVPDSVQPIDILVGQSWLDLPQVTLIMVDDKLVIGNRNENPFCDISVIEKNSRVTLTLPKDETIHKKSVNFVKVLTNSADTNIMVSSREGEMPILVSSSADGGLVLPVINRTTDNIYRKRGECLARGETVNIIGSISQDGQPEQRPILISELKVDETAPTDRVQQLHELISEFRDCFAMDLKELGCTNVATMHIEEVPGSKPVRCKPYKTNAKEREAMQEIIQDWKRHGIVSETRSPYASPALLVKKKTGEYRLVVDYRRLNMQTVKDRFPLPHIDYQLEQLSGCSLFTVLDMAHGYLQIPLDEDSKKKTAFITSDDSGQFERMIFGLANAPSEFQRAMFTALGPLRNSVVMCYMDDLLIPARDWNELLERLRLVLEALRKAKFTLRLNKCEFGRREIEYLGFVISSEGTRPGTKKTRAITSFPQPKNVHELRRFLGLTSFFRRFVTHHARRAEPLTRLTMKNQPFIWTDEQDKSFNDLKTALTSSPVLQLYNADAKTEVHTDASAEGLAGMLLQEGRDGKMHLVYCVSKKTTPAERDYHSSKLELAAIIWTITRLRQFLIGIPFVVYTDCQALVYLNAKRTTNPQIARWYTMLQEYQILEVKHRPGIKMAHVDAISRAPETAETSTESLEDTIFRRIDVMLSLTMDDQVMLLQQSDEDVKLKINILKKPLEERTRRERELTQGLVLNNNLLYKVITEGDACYRLFVIPNTMRKSITVRAHDLSGHFGIDRTIAKLKEHYWFPSMRRYVKHHISHCFECLINKVPGGKRPGLLQPIIPGTRPFEVINMDHLGPFVTSSKGNQYILLMVDNLTKFVHLYPVRNTSTQQVLKNLDSLVTSRGLPTRIITDRASSFTSRSFEEYCQRHGIVHTLNATRHPRANGQVERVNRTVLPMIAISIQNPSQRDWDVQLKVVERDLNNAVNKATGKTPFELLHGYRPQFHDGRLRVVTADTSSQWQPPEKLQANARDLVVSKHEKMKRDFNKKHYVAPDYTVGQLVVMRRVPTHTGESTKTQPKYRGPLVIAARVSQDTYRVSQLQSVGTGRFFSSVVHVSQLKPWGTKSSVNDGDDAVMSGSDEEPSQKKLGVDKKYGSEAGRISHRVRKVPSYYQC